MNEDFNRDSIVNLTADDLALRCLAHLEQEDAMLQASWELVQQTRKALLERDQQRPHELLERQQSTAAAAQKLHAARQMIRRDIAACFSIPAEDASLGYLAQRTSADRRDQLLSQRRQLSDLAEKVDLLNRGNVALAGQVMELLHGVLHRLTGENPQPARYERTGRMARYGVMTGHSSR